MSLMLPSPDGIPWEQWSGLVGSQPPVSSTYIIERPEENWRDWANEFVGISSVRPFIPPGPELYTDWRDWVNALRHAIPTSYF